MIKQKKYNVIVVFLLLTISLVVGLSAGVTRDRTNISFDDNADFEIIEDNTSNNDDEEVTNDLPLDAGAYERLDYAFDALNNGEGFISQMYQEFSIVGNVQYTVLKKYRGGGYDLTEEWYKMQGVFGGLGQNQFISVFFTQEDFKIKTITNSKNYDYNAKTYNKNYGEADLIEEQSIEKWNETHIGFNDFILDITRETATILNYDNKGRGKDYYTVSVKINIDKLDAKYLKLFEVNNAVDVKVNTITVTFKISKNTGYFLGYEASGNFTAVALSIPINCDVKIKETYTIMNKSAYSSIKSIAKESFEIEI